jgi:outer membrane receptor protein involved in Fe transport
MKNALMKNHWLGITGAMALVCLVLGCLVSAPAAAQAQDVQGQQSANQLEQVVVTASRQGEENIQNIPMAISAISPESLEKFGLGGLEDYAKMVPSLSLQQFGPGINKIDIRGITTSGIDYTDVQDRPLVAVYLDDTPISLQAQNPDIKVFDLERAEVLRGPQGTLYGAGAMSGTIRLITKKPDLQQFSASSGVNLSDTESGYGSFNYSLRQMVNIPIIDGELAMRALVYRGDDSGFIENIGQGDKAHADTTNQARLAVRFKPSEDFIIDGSITYEDLEAGVHDGFSGLGPYQFTSLEPELTKDSLKIFNVTVEKDFEPAVLTSSTSFLDRNNANLAANEYGVNAFLFGAQLPLDPALDIVSNNTKDFVEELRVVSRNSSMLKWTSGVFFERFRRDYFQDQPATNFDTRWGNEIGFPTYSSLDDGAFHANDDFSGDQNSSERQVAVFGQATYTPIPNLDMTAGLRYFDWHQDFVLYFGGVFGVSPFATSPTSLGVPLTESGTAHASGVNPRFALDYHFTEDDMIFAEAAKGFRYGGVNQPVPISICAPYLAQLGLTQAPLTFGPDKLWSYSLGEKSSFLDRRVSLNLTGFFIDWTDVQTTRDLACSYYFIENKGKIESRGAELEAVARITQAFRVSLNGSYTNATTDGLIENLNAPSGSPTPFDPKWIANVAATYDVPVGDDILSLSGNYAYRSRAGTTFNPTDSNYRVIPLSRTLDAALTYEMPTFQVGLFGSNLTNGNKIVNIGAEIAGSLEPGDTYFYARPRTFGVRLTAQFK